MKIAKVTLTNFGIYKGENVISFTPFGKKNINIITGKNGYGKTTFLTSLIWAFYGKMMSHVEDKYRRDIKSYNGYDNFIFSLLNRDVQREFEKGESSSSNFSVEVILTELLIPSIPCNEVCIKRSFDSVKRKETLSIYIDGVENELTKEVGYEVFINDFILPREIAKFFFFDAEKIVSLAEAKTKDELRSLSKAYSEVLGIKKYEELKNNLETLLTKLKRNSVSDLDRSKLKVLIKKEKELVDLIDLNLGKQTNIENEILAKRKISDDLQEKLIREGNSITLEELKILKNNRDRLKKQLVEIKSKLHKLMEFVPLVIAGKKLVALKDQLKKEQQVTINSVNARLFRKHMKLYSQEVLGNLHKIDFSEEDLTSIEKVLKSTLANKYNKINIAEPTNVLLGFNKEQYLNFETVYSNINGNFVSQLNDIIEKEKGNRILLSKVNKKIKEAEARKNNAIAKKYREERDSINLKTEVLVDENNVLLQELGQLKTKLQSIRKELTERDKNYNIVETDKNKYEVTQNLLLRINIFITRIKEEKKYALQKSLKLGLNKLMHKEDFITNVKVNIDGDIMDIKLIDPKGNTINKDSLSKGEQQLYATALLKALVDESGIQFPVFIDSPLQKFDKKHSQNIIEEFYPSISNQVVLLPLLEKELTEDEFKLLQPNLNKTYTIENNKNGSSFEQSDLMELFKNTKTNVYAN